MATEPCYIDSNVAMYAAGAAHPLKAPSLAFLQAVARSEIQAVTSVEVLEELLHRYTALGQRERAVAVVEDFMEAVPEVLPVSKEDIALALPMHLANPTLQVRDVIHLATMRHFGLDTIVTADRHFDTITTIHRVDPAQWRQLLS